MQNPLRRFAPPPQEEDTVRLKNKRFENKFIVQFYSQIPDHTLILRYAWFSR